MKHRKDAPPLKTIVKLVQDGRFAEAYDLAAGFPPDSAEKERDGEDGAGPLGRSALYWKGTMEQAAALERYAASEYLVARWDEFSRSPTACSLPESFGYALQEYVFHQALAGYLDLYRESGIEDAAVLLRIGRLRKGLGDYELAIQAFEQARSRSLEDARLIALLADCYALINETRAAKLLFREAFHLDPAAIDLDELEAPFIAEIADRLWSAGTPADEIVWWLPVWAAADGVFNVRRELKPVEIGRLTQSIDELERARAAAPTERGRALLLNRYFRLADHYASVKAPPEDLASVLRRIRDIDPGIYERYIH